eukprot:21442_1
MVHWFILFAMLITSSEGGTITCNTGTCAGTTVDCPDDGQTCTIICGPSGCKLTTINCLDGYLCRVELGGAQSARQATINGKGATRLEVITGASADKQLEEANITCPHSATATCYIHCDSTGAFQNCRELSINAENSNTLWLSCEHTDEACVGVDVWCPRNNNNANACTFDGQTDTGAMTGMKVYSVNGFRSMTVNNGVSSASIGWMYCLNDYSASCEFDPNAPTSQMACLSSGSTICDDPPTVAPTVSPVTAQPTTMQPTTNMPTTATPTTTQPTTVNPTTVSPTSAMPTTFNPTTMIPTTTLPTTSLPTTTSPTTSSPTTTSPTTTSPTTAIPTTANPTTSNPSTSIPTTSIPTTTNPTTFTPTASNPTTFNPTTFNTTTFNPTTSNPTTLVPTTNAPSTNVATTNIPSVKTTIKPMSANPTTIYPTILPTILTLSPTKNQPTEYTSRFLTFIPTNKPTSDTINSGQGKIEINVNIPDVSNINIYQIEAIIANTTNLERTQISVELINDTFVIVIVGSNQQIDYIEKKVNDQSIAKELEVTTGQEVHVTITNKKYGQPDQVSAVFAVSTVYIYFTIIIAVILILILTIGYVHAKCIQTNDFFKASAICATLFQVLDLISDIFLSVNIN